MRRRVLVVSNDLAGTRMAGPAIRAWRFAAELASEHDVTLSVPAPADLHPDGFDLAVVNPFDARAMLALARRFDVVVAQRLPVPTMLALARTRTRVVHDLYAPIAIENLALDRLQEYSRARRLRFRLALLEQEVAIATGSAFVCASERQRDLWLGVLLHAGRLDHDTYADDRSLRALIDVVPFGVDPVPPTMREPVLRGVVDRIGPDDRILLWNGGIWNWFDPLTVIRAVDRLRRRRDDVRLFFLGTKHPNPAIEEMAMAHRAVALSDELGLRGRHVFFNEGWVPYEQLGAYLLEADLGVSAHFDDLETRFAFRTRLVDCIWAGLPVVTTRGDALADVVESAGLGRTVDAEDVSGYAAALEALLDKSALRDRLAPAFAAARAALEWPRAVEPLRRLVETAPPAPGPPYTVLGRWAADRTELAVRNRGIAGAGARLARLAVRRARVP